MPPATAGAPGAPETPRANRDRTKRGDMSNQGRKRAYTGTAALALAALTGAGLHAAFPPIERATAEVTSAVAHPASRGSLTMADGFADLAESTTPAVVRIEVQIPNGARESSDESDMPQMPE